MSSCGRFDKARAMRCGALEDEMTCPTAMQMQALQKLEPDDAGECDDESEQGREQALP
jgi:hypothetical protein